MDTIIFKIDKKIKKAAQKEAKKRGFSLADYYREKTIPLAEGRVDMGFVVHPKLKASVIRDLKEISEDIKKGKNLSPTFKNAEEAINYLKSL